MDKKRCGWVENTFDAYILYHDREWGVPVHDDRVHFEFLVLESAQSGLSWATILKRRDGYRKAFADFNVQQVADFTDTRAEELMQDTGIIRNRAKILAAINNARCFLEIQKEFGSFDAYIWQFVGSKTIVRSLHHHHDAPATTPESDLLAKDMKRRGFKFLGSTTLYAHMQATGLVNDHTVDCFRFHEVQASE